MIDQHALAETVKQKLASYLFIVVSNREPFVHTYVENEVKCQVPASGLTAALDPVMRACGGTWIAHGSGDADRAVVDEKNKVAVPPDDPKYSLKRVWLSKEEEAGYYYGFSNEALWPLCHIAYTRPVFRESDWKAYQKVNRLFADAVLEEAGDRKAFVFVQDYHLALVPRMLKEANRNIIVAQFWHIPWPNREAFRICPWQDEIIDGLLGNDLLGFHIRYHCNNFLDTVDRAIEARVDWERYEVNRQNRKTSVQPFPISVDFAEINREAQSSEVGEEIEKFKKKLGLEKQIVGLGLDRIDYTKGIPDRLKAFDHFLETWPEYKGRVVFVQAGVPSRVHIGVYKALNDEIDRLVEEINWKHGTERWKPIIYLCEHLSPVKLDALRRMAHFCVVNSLHDGMNLVAKEYVASRSDEDGVLILSPFMGASRELTTAVQVNPYATGAFAASIKGAIEMPREERQRRMKKMREVVAENNIYKWAADLISSLARFEFGNGG